MVAEREATIDESKVRKYQKAGSRRRVEPLVATA